MINSQSENVCSNTDWMASRSSASRLNVGKMIDTAGMAGSRGE